MSEDNDNKDSDYFGRVASLNLPDGEKYMMQVMYIVQTKVIEKRNNKPFQEWDFEDMFPSHDHLKSYTYAV